MKKKTLITILLTALFTLPGLAQEQPSYEQLKDMLFAAKKREAELNLRVQQLETEINALRSAVAQQQSAAPMDTQGADPELVARARKEIATLTDQVAAAKAKMAAENTTDPFADSAGIRMSAADRKKRAQAQLSQIREAEARIVTLQAWLAAQAP